jgi:hypothetical protein
MRVLCFFLIGFLLLGLAPRPTDQLGHAAAAHQTLWRLNLRNSRKSSVAAMGDRGRDLRQFRLFKDNEALGAVGRRLWMTTIFIGS